MLWCPMADDQSELDRLRDHWHELRNAVDATAITVAVVQERQKAHSEQMDRIESAVLTCTDLLTQQNGRLSRSETAIAVLEARRVDAATSGAKWGGAVGAAVSGLIAGLAQWAKGGGG